MPEYIERETAVSWFIPYAHAEESIDADVVISDIKGMKAADVALVRHGRWLDGKCTVCGWEEPDVCTYGGYETESWVETPYCPNCGAKMMEG